VLIEQNAVKTRGSIGYTRMAPSFANIGTKQAMSGQYQAPRPILPRQGQGRIKLFGAPRQ